MAKLSSINKNNTRREKAERYLKHRKELRKQAKDIHLSEDQRWEAQVKLQKLPQETRMNWVINRCYLTGRPRGHLRKFGLSRIAMRELALTGKLPGVTKASW